jgi:carbonic anhydrase/acetyltransferase-like protein (isoleucine patch superfamily)
LTIYEFEGQVPKIGDTSYINQSASVIGRVTIGEQCYVAPGAVVKGDYGEIVIGDGTSVQDNVIIHARPGEKTTIGSNVTLGHGCIIHNAIVEDEAVIGMGAIVSDYAVVKRWALVAEGAVVRNNFEVPENKIVVGVPAKILTDLKASHREELTRFKEIYKDLAKRYPTGLKKISD